MVSKHLTSPQLVNCLIGWIFLFIETLEVCEDHQVVEDDVPPTGGHSYHRAVWSPADQQVGPQLRHRLGGPPVGDDWNAWLGIPDEDAVLSQDGYQDPVPVSGHPDGVRATLLWEGQHARPSYRIVH